MTPREISALVDRGKLPSPKELESLLTPNMEDQLFEEAHRIKKERFGNEIRIRAILEFSNHCRRQCAYCGLNRNHTDLPRYRMAPQEIVAQTLTAWEAGYQTIVLQSGEDPYYTAGLVCEIVKEIKRRCPIAITLSLGERPYEELKAFREAGADRYLLKHETADPEIYRSLHPCGTLEERVTCLKNLKSLGYETGSGFMVGLPGQTTSTLVNDILLLREIPCDMAGIGPFLPNPATALAHHPPGDSRLTARAVAVTRLLLPGANLPATTALEVLDAKEKQHVFFAGANVIMKKITPPAYQELYEIYPSPTPRELDIQKDRRKLEEQLRSLGLIPC